MSQGGAAQIIKVMSQRNFGLFTLGNSISLIGIWMQRIASGWLAWTLTESAGWVGAVAFADLFPVLIVGPFAGAAADRHDRMKAMMVGRLAMLGIAVLLTVLFYLDRLTIWPLLILTFLSGTITGILQPFRLAVTSALVTREWLTVAVAMNSVTFNVARFLGPAAAGLMIAAGGLGLTYAATALTCAVFAVMLTFVRVSNSMPPPRAASGLWFDTIQGVRHAFTMPGVSAILIQLLLSGLLVRPVVELLPGWASEVFAGTARDFAALTSSFGFGAILAGLWLAARPGVAGLTAVLMAANLIMSGALLMFASVSQILVALVLAAIVGFAMSVATVTAQSLTQMAVPDHLRGRVLGVYGLIMRGSPALGALAMGIASDHFGMRPPLVVGVAVFSAVLVWYLVRFRQLRAHLEREE